MKTLMKLLLGLCYLQKYLNKGLISVSCADPEGFVRGGPIRERLFLFFCCCFFSLMREEGSIYHC